MRSEKSGSDIPQPIYYKGEFYKVFGSERSPLHSEREGSRYGGPDIDQKHGILAFRVRKPNFCKTTD